jgi:hypothetical protein
MSQFKHKRNNIYEVSQLKPAEFKEVRILLEKFGYKLYYHGTNKYKNNYEFENKMRE